MSKSNEKFMEISNFYKLSTSLFKFALFKSNKDIDYIVFIEGETDKVFYENTSMSFFVDNRIEFIVSECMCDNVENHGKKAVVDLCSQILDLTPKSISKCVFIVDHDYFGLDEFLPELVNKIKKYVTVLPVYSFENFFLLFENLKRIEKRYMYDEQIKSFKHSYDQFLIMIHEYMALRWTLTACLVPNKTIHINIKINYKKSYDEMFEIFNCNDANQLFINKEKLDFEVKIMNDKIKPHRELEHYKIEALKYIETNDDKIKGKILLNFLLKYLKEVNGINIKMYEGEEYIKLIKLINVNFEIKLTG